jgi:hypothetical protein
LTAAGREHAAPRARVASRMIVKSRRLMVGHLHRQWSIGGIGTFLPQITQISQI